MTPVEDSHRIFTAFLLIEYDIVDHVLMGLLTFYKQKILGFNKFGNMMKFIKNDMLSSTLRTDHLGSLFLVDSLELFSGNLGVRSNNKFDALIAKEIDEENNKKSDEEEEDDDEDFVCL